MKHRNLAALPAFDHDSTDLNVVIESPRGRDFRDETCPARDARIRSGKNQDSTALREIT